MKCKDAEPHLQAVADGETRGWLMSRVLQHLAKCEHCQDHLERLKSFKTFLQGRLPRREAPEALRAAIQAQIRTAQVESARPTSWWAGRPLQLAAAFAIVFLVAWAAFQFGLGGTESVALADHSRRVVNCHQVNVAGEKLENTDYHMTNDPLEIRQWLASHEVNHEIKIPMPEGFRVIGGTYRHYGDNPVTCVMYEGSDEAVCFFVMRGEETEVAGRHTYELEDGTRVYFRTYNKEDLGSEKEFNVMIWVKDDVYYSLVSSAPEKELARYVSKFREQLT